MMRNINECDKSLLELDFEGLDKKYVCFNCNMVYENKEAYEEHKNSRRHLLCVLNKETGDKVVEELIHFYCFICKVQCRNMQAYTHHLFEPKHLTLSTEESDLENKTNLYVCSMCNIVMDQEAKEGHIYDKKHLRKSLQNDTWITLASLVQENITTTNFNCPYCNVSLNSFVKYSEHLLSEEHINTMIEDRLKGYKVPPK
ncbi:hypothetical protein J6590_063036 [Homalodisca vitripennis]|nr:hypothetical protein J6590_063036 [Homalodisca vitripennis]